MEKLISMPPNWASTSLGEICSLINGDRGKNYPSKDKLSEKGFPFVNAGHIESGRIKSDGMNFIDQERISLLNSGKFILGDILFCIRGSLGKVAINKNIEKGAIASSLIIVRPKNAVVGLFVLYYLSSPLAAYMVRKYDNGTAQPNLSGADLARFEFPLPPLAEQRRIVTKIETLFSELDKGIESLKAAREQLKVYRQAVLKHAFEGKLTAHWREQNKDKLETQQQLLARLKIGREARYQQNLQDWRASIKDSVKKKLRKPREPKPITDLTGEVKSWLPDAPAGWSWQKLGWMTCGAEYGTSAKSAETGDTPVIRMGNLQNGLIDWADLVFTSDKEEIKKYELNTDDILFNRTNSPELVGKTSIYRGERPAVFAGYLIRINQINTVVIAKYLNFFLNSHFAKKHGSTVKTDGVNQSNINAEKLQSYPFPYCSLYEQHEVVRIVEEKLSQAESLLTQIDKEIKKSETLRQAVLKKAFSGQLVPQKHNENNASALLEPIHKKNEATI